MTGDDIFHARVRALEFAVGITPEGQTVAQLLRDAAKIETYLLRKPESKFNAD